MLTHSYRDIEIVDEKLCISIILLFLYQHRGCWLFFWGYLIWFILLAYVRLNEHTTWTRAYIPVSNTQHKDKKRTSESFTTTNDGEEHCLSINFTEKNNFFASVFCINFIVGRKIKSP